MTGDELRERVEYWQEVLGLTHWDLTIEVVTHFHASPDHYASCLNHDDYDSSTVSFQRSWLDDASDDDIEECVVHELLHVLMRNHDEAVGRIEDQVARAVGDLWHETVRHERENLVDRLCKIIVDNHGQ